jgi:hypothetical protein
MPITRHNTVNVIAAAILAFESNNSTIVKYDNFSSAADATEPALIPNKKLMNQYFAEPSQSDKILGKYVESAQHMIETITRRVTMNMLTGEITNDFLMSISDLVGKDQITNNEFGLASWVPKLFRDMNTAEDTRITMLTQCANSKFVGADNKSVTLNFTPVIKRFLSNYGIWAYTGYDSNGNMISFTNKKELALTELSVAGRVKKYEYSKKFANIPCTVLNYVKILKIKE